MKDMLKKYGVLLFVSIAALCITLVAGIKGSKDDALYNKVSFGVKNNMNNDGVKIWKNNSIAYIFLPAYAERDSVTFSDNEYNIKLKLGSNTYESGDKIKNLELDKEYDAELVKNNKKENFKLSFYKANDTATIYIDTESQSLYKVNEDKDNKEAGSMKIIDRDGKINYDSDIEYISGRGNYSWMWGDKKSYNIKLNEGTDLLNLGASDKWCLNANCFDKSSLKNKMIYDFAKEMRMPFTPDTAYVDVYFNGEYAGIYLLSEKLNVEKNRVNIHDLQADNDLLNGYGYHDVMIEYNNKRGYKAENEPSKMDGGYLMELLPYDREYTSGFFTRNNNVLISIDSPKYITLNELEYISKFVSVLLVYSPSTCPQDKS
ncbi:MAG: CotH kinase family protein [Lachnospiraceae bacterium]|nr:CotH kinase family protein [Lachnospiraceae bacterium]